MPARTRDIVKIEPSSAEGARKMCCRVRVRIRTHVSNRTLVRAREGTSDTAFHMLLSTLGNSRHVPGRQQDTCSRQWTVHIAQRDHCGDAKSSACAVSSEYNPIRPEPSFLAASIYKKSKRLNGVCDRRGIRMRRRLTIIYCDDLHVSQRQAGQKMTMRRR